MYAFTILIFEYEWSMPNKHTFLIKPIKRLLSNYNFTNWLDPFAGYNSPATITNDLNPDIKADYHLDALEFLCQFPPNSIDGVLFDPPYSLRQIVECYKKVGMKVTNETTQSLWHTRLRNQIKYIIKPGGRCISFGWSSNGIGKVRGFEKERILLVPHGGSHNDTIVTVERKINNILPSIS